MEDDVMEDDDSRDFEVKIGKIVKLGQLVFYYGGPGEGARLSLNNGGSVYIEERDLNKLVRFFYEASTAIENNPDIMDVIQKELCARRARKEMENALGEDDQRSSAQILQVDYHLQLDGKRQGVYFSPSPHLGQGKLQIQCSGGLLVGAHHRKYL